MIWYKAIEEIILTCWSKIPPSKGYTWAENLNDIKELFLWIVGIWLQVKSER